MSAPVIKLVPIDKIKISSLRRKVNEEKAKEYAESIKEIGLLHPIILNDEYKLVAGRHRIRAYKILGKTSIEAKIYKQNDLILKLIEIDENLMRNELHCIERGIVLVERKNIYEKIYPNTSFKERKSAVMNKAVHNKKVTLPPPFTSDTAAKIGVTARTVQQEIKLIKDLSIEVREKAIKIDLIKSEAIKLSKKPKEDQNKLIDIVISKKVNVDKAVRILQSYKRKEHIEKSSTKTFKSDIKILDELNIKINQCNIWSFGKRNEEYGTSHYGNQPSELVFNLLYYYSKQDDLVWDVFAGGGVVHDVCNSFKRNCYSTDLSPTREFINKWNAVEWRLPDIDPQFIFLDVPYWIQAKNKYSTNKDDFGNMPLDKFYSELDYLFERIHKKYTKFTLAFLIGNTQYANEDKHVEPHGFKVYKLLEKYFKFEHHIICPYNLNIYSGNQIIVAKRDKLILNLHRDLLIFKN